MIDISVPEYPTLLASENTPGEAYAVAVSGTHAFVSARTSGLQVIDITDPADPQLVDQLETPGTAWGVAISETHAYIADNTSIQVIDISDPTSCHVVGSVPTPGQSFAILLDGNYAYVANLVEGLQVIDISAPEDPQLVATYATQTSAWSVGLSPDGSFAYVTDQSFGMQVFNIEDPENANLIGSIDTPGWPSSVAVLHNQVFVADGVFGLQVLPAQCMALSGIVEDDEDPGSAEIPQLLSRLSVHPNPFNPRTTVSFGLDHTQNVELCVFDMAGNRLMVLANQTFQAGAHTVDWQGIDSQGRAVSSGIYLVRMLTDKEVVSEKMMLIR